MLNFTRNNLLMKPFCCYSEFSNGKLMAKRHLFVTGNIQLTINNSKEIMINEFCTCLIMQSILTTPLLFFWVQPYNKRLNGILNVVR